MCSSAKKCVVGIQGGKGSFNEEAFHAFVERGDVPKECGIKYCYATRRVLDAVEDASVKYGIFAIYNSRSLMVEETMHELGAHRFRVCGFVTIPIRHMLMTIPGVSRDAITCIAGHAEALAQCAQTLKRQFPSVPQYARIDDMVDGAMFASALARGDARIAQTTAILGSQAIAQAYNLRIIAHNLHDDPHNTTTFLLVKRL